MIFFLLSHYFHKPFAGYIRYLWNRTYRIRWPCFWSIAVLGTLSGTVLAHAVLVSSNPPHGAVLTEPPATLVLQFNAILETSMTNIVLVDTLGNKLRLPFKPDSPPSRIRVDVPPLPPGAYTVVFKMLARDGHVTEGSIRFTILKN